MGVYVRVQAEPSEIFLTVNGAECRIWNAITEQGEQVFLFVACVAARPDLANLGGLEPIDVPEFNGVKR